MGYFHFFQFTLGSRFVPINSQCFSIWYSHRFNKITSVDLDSYFNYRSIVTSSTSFDHVSFQMICVLNSLIFDCYFQSFATRN